MISADGLVWRDGGFVRGHAFFGPDGTSFGEGPLDGPADVRGLITPPLTDCHTHCADAGVKPPPGATLEQLVAPPDGLKHVYLRNTPRETLVSDMREFGAAAASNGITSFVDFREGGAEGCRMLSESGVQAVIYGRPVSPVFDPSEISDILSAADGIALPSVSDMDRTYIEKTADACRRAGRPFALHVSERVREDMDFVLSLDPAFVVHMVEATDRDIRACADAGVPVVVCPRSNRFFGKTPPLARMVSLGAEVCLGTDNAMLCAPDMRPEARLAADILSAQGGDPSLVWNMLLDVPEKILNRSGCSPRKEKGGEQAAVLPSEGADPMRALLCDRPAFLPRNEGSQ